MRILQIVTLITPDNVYGGPVRVAVNQVRALREAGHAVDLLAGFKGYPSAPESLDGEKVISFPAFSLVPKTGFAGLVSPQMLSFLKQRIHDYDVVHIHLARDLVTLPAAVIAASARLPFVIQTHGMIDESDKRLAHTLDFLLTRRVMSAAAAALFLTATEELSLLNLFGAQLKRLHKLPNGVPVTSSFAEDTANFEILYLARLHARKRPLEFAKAAQQIHREFPYVTFSIVGPDEGEATRVLNFIEQNALQDVIKWEGSIAPERSLERMRKARIYVLPSVDEPFPMSVLEAMSLGLPVVVTSTNGLAGYIQEAQAGIVTSDDLASLHKAMHFLIQNDEDRDRMGQNARDLIGREFSISAVVGQLLLVYENCLRRRSEWSVSSRKE